MTRAGRIAAVLALLGGLLAAAGWFAYRREHGRAQELERQRAALCMGVESNLSSAVEWTEHPGDPRSQDLPVLVRALFLNTQISRMCLGVEVPVAGGDAGACYFMSGDSKCWRELLQGLLERYRARPGR